MKLLFADDSVTMQKVIQLTLENEDVDVVIAGNGSEALEAIKNDIPDIIISDVSMPEMDGFEFCRQVKGNPETNKIPFVLISGELEKYDDKKGEEAGADGHITKPFKSEEFISTLHSYIKAKAAAHTEAEEVMASAKADYFSGVSSFDEPVKIITLDTSKRVVGASVSSGIDDEEELEIEEEDNDLDDDLDDDFDEDLDNELDDLGEIEAYTSPFDAPVVSSKLNRYEMESDDNGDKKKEAPKRKGIFPPIGIQGDEFTIPFSNRRKDLAPAGAAPEEIEELPDVEEDTASDIDFDRIDMEPLSEMSDLDSYKQFDGGVASAGGDIPVFDAEKEFNEMASAGIESGTDELVDDFGLTSLEDETGQMSFDNGDVTDLDIDEKPVGRASKLDLDLDSSEPLEESEPDFGLDEKAELDLDTYGDRASKLDLDIDIDEPLAESETDFGLDENAEMDLDTYGDRASKLDLDIDIDEPLAESETDFGLDENAEMDLDTYGDRASKLDLDIDDTTEESDLDSLPDDKTDLDIDYDIEAPAFAASGVADDDPLGKNPLSSSMYTDWHEEEKPRKRLDLDLDISDTAENIASAPPASEEIAYGDDTPPFGGEPEDESMTDYDISHDGEDHDEFEDVLAEFGGGVLGDSDSGADDDLFGPGGGETISVDNLVEEPQEDEKSDEERLWDAASKEPELMQEASDLIKEAEKKLSEIDSTYHEEDDHKDHETDLDALWDYLQEEHKDEARERAPRLPMPEYGDESESALPTIPAQALENAIRNLITGEGNDILKHAIKEAVDQSVRSIIERQVEDSVKEEISKMVGQSFQLAMPELIGMVGKITTQITPKIAEQMIKSAIDQIKKGEA
ncbi:MAG: response regulator [Nitrospinota bacterium]|nr:response regulator [Nitrospinota bacterium]